MSLKRISDLSVKVHAEVSSVAPRRAEGLPGQKLGKRPESYWSMVAAGPVATDVKVNVSAPPPPRMPAGIQIAPVAAKGAAAVGLSGATKPALRHISETEARALEGAWQALQSYESPKAMMQAIETATAPRNVLITVGDLVKQHRVNSTAVDAPDASGVQQRLLILDRSLVATKRGGPSRRLVTEMYGLLLRERPRLGVATDQTALKIGSKDVFFKNELELNRHRDQLERELGETSDYESDYVVSLRQELRARGGWARHKDAVLAALSPELKARFTEVSVKGLDVTLGELVDGLEELSAGDPKRTYVDVDGVAMSTVDLMGGLQSGLEGKLFTTEDVMREAQRPHLADPDAREALRDALSRLSKQL